MTQMNLQSYAVWDRPTRWFHWINFACVVALAAIGTAILYDKELGVTDGGKILLKTTHVWFGYVFAINWLGVSPGPSLAIGTQLGPPFFRSTLATEQRSKPIWVN
jgi:hypothetical protein